MKRNIFVTSDTFFGRSQIIKSAKRPFKTVDEMNAALIDRWNSVVKDGDLVYHLGNFAWDPSSADDAAKLLNGDICLIKGEYDDAAQEVSKFIDTFTIVQNDILKELKTGIVLSHWPLHDWPGKRKGNFHFHGNSIKRNKTDLKKMKRVNVCCDNWNFTPQNIEDLLDLFKDFEK